MVCLVYVWCFVLLVSYIVYYCFWLPNRCKVVYVPKPVETTEILTRKDVGFIADFV